VNLRSDIIDTVRLGLCCADARINDGQDIYVSEYTATRGRGKLYSVTFYCASHHGKRRTNRGDGEMAASWTAYGYLIARLFLVDPQAVIGSYENVHDFTVQCAALSEGRAEYIRANPRSGPNPYADISFLKLVEDCAAVV
jgi:hypothetical protein